jgi:predicted PhzF superfamily epimerase YddE/YHI9
MSLLVSMVRVFTDDAGEHGNPLGILWSSPQTRRREQQIAADLGFSETVFIDQVDGAAARARIFTPTRELPFAGHPTVGLAAWLRAGGEELTAIDVPAGRVRVRTEGDEDFVTALPDWAPPFELTELPSPADVDAVDPDAFADGQHYLWAWSDETAGDVRARMFGPELGIREDEATGAAAVRLTAHLGRDLRIVQGRGSVLRTHPRYLGQQIEVGGRTSEASVVELR